MDVAAFYRQSHVLIVAGKGGVGKTTVAAALARATARCGLRTLIIELEASSGLAAAFGQSHGLSYHESSLEVGGPGGPDSGERADPGAEGPGRTEGSGQGEIRGRVLTPDDALLDYLADHGLRRVSKRLMSSGAAEVISTAVPGVRDILVLGKVKQLERAETADVIIIDAPAAGHAITFLTSAAGLLDSARGGPVRSQASEVVEMLSDPSRCQVILVTLPEETPINEAVETAYKLEDRVGISLGPVVVNGLYPHLEGLDVDPLAVAGAAGMTLAGGQAEAMREAAVFRGRRQQLQSEQVRRLAEALPLPQITLPYLFTTSIGVAQSAMLADALVEGIRALPEPGPDGYGGQLPDLAFTGPVSPGDLGP